MLPIPDLIVVEQRFIMQICLRFLLDPSFVLITPFIQSNHEITSQDHSEENRVAAILQSLH